MPRCPNCSYMLVLLEKRRKYKCAKCSKLFFQKEIDNRHFREQNKRIFLEDMKRINPSMYYHREFAKNHPEKIKQYQINYKRNKLEGRFKKRLNLTDEDRRERTNRYARAYYYKNKDNIKEKLKKWREKNIDKIREYSRKRIRKARISNRKYYKNNRNKVLAMRKRYYSNKDNREKIMARVKNYKMRNIDKSKLLNRIAWWRQQQKSLAVDYLENIDKKALNLNIFDSPPT
ncbi:MAG TPA: hypothetical protein VJJ53_01085 [Candidatus Nanoarchaeia archaeon]|nr:hypothetical protein [Candidatus Nanoarchaeia archaeon]